MAQIHIAAHDKSCELVKTEIHTSTNLYIPVQADRLIEMLAEAAAQTDRKQITEGVVRVDLDDSKFTITNHPSSFTITLREYVRGIEVAS